MNQRSRLRLALAYKRKVDAARRQQNKQQPAAPVQSAPRSATRLAGRKAATPAKPTAPIGGGADVAASVLPPVQSAIPASITSGTSTIDNQQGDSIMTSIPRYRVAADTGSDTGTPLQKLAAIIGDPDRAYGVDVYTHASNRRLGAKAAATKALMAPLRETVQTMADAVNAQGRNRLFVEERPEGGMGWQSLTVKYRHGLSAERSIRFLYMSDNGGHDPHAVAYPDGIGSGTTSFDPASNPDGFVEPLGVWLNNAMGRDPRLRSAIHALAGAPIGDSAPATPTAAPQAGELTLSIRPR